MRASSLAVLLLSLWPFYAQADDVFPGACKPGRYDTDKGLDGRHDAPECYSSQEMIRGLRDMRSFPVIMATSAQSKTSTRMYTFNPQSHEGYELIVDAPVVACSVAQQAGKVEACPDPARLDAYGATRALVVDHYDQAQFMDIKAKGARSFDHDANVMFRARSLSRELPFVVVKTYRGSAAGTGFQRPLDNALDVLTGFEFIDYTADGKALLGNP